MTSTYHIYCHIPFCKMRCPFCCFVDPFLNKELLDLSLISDFVKALKEEILSYDFPDLPLESIVFGGGTPSLLSPEQAQEILSAIDLKTKGMGKHPRWVSFEATPDTATIEKLKGFYEAGFNRVSIGIQSFFETELRLLGRSNSKSQALSAISNAKKIGFEATNIDLFCGFPGNTFESWWQNVNEALELDVENISIYVYTFSYAGSDKYVKALQSGGFTCPPKEEIIRMFRYAMERFQKQGYVPVNYFLYSKPRAVCNYERDLFRMANNIIGFGPFSTSHCSDVIYVTYPSIKEYIKNPFHKHLSSPYRSNTFQYFFGNIMHNGWIDRDKAKGIFQERLEDVLEKDELTREIVKVFLDTGYGCFDARGFHIREELLPEVIVELWDCSVRNTRLRAIL